MSHNHASHKSENNGNLMCPVMKGTPVNKVEAEKAGLVREYNGKKYYFCCEACVIEFDLNPKAYE
jgi:YHS domain-containing protein